MVAYPISVASKPTEVDVIIINTPKGSEITPHLWWDP